MNIPDHIPAGMSFAEGYRNLRDACREAQSLPEEDMRTFLGSLADRFDEFANSLDPQAE
ncbi:hypothetical protein SAMN06265360_107183 [Haloechinothrix alba]|uniref:Uncharacterized protein n=1 Tax=Haloechinothrix alba TaxID=664784 RepID=A0A238WSW7_9PSEU|nr:hypothetical protein SAMN06265360_107183 [Haloechinothrix alba]